MRRAVLVFCCSGIFACGTMRNRDVVHPPAPTAGETSYLITGDFDAADRSLKEARATVPTVTDAFLRGDLLDAIGRPEEALELYFSALSEAHRSGESPDAAVASAQAVTAIRDRIERFGAKLERFWTGIENRRGNLPFEAWYQLLNLRFGGMRMLGDPRADAVRAALGCPESWRLPRSRPRSNAASSSSFSSSPA